MSCAKTAEPIDLPFGCGLGRAKRSTNSIVFVRWRQRAVMGGYTATWRIRLNRPTAAAMRPYVKLLRPLVIIIKPQRSTMYDVVRRCGLLLQTEERGRSVGLSVTIVSPAKKGLNRSRCPFDYGLGWVQGSIIRWGSHWRNLANTIESSMCGGAMRPFCQMTLTTCYQLHTEVMLKVGLSGRREVL